MGPRTGMPDPKLFLLRLDVIDGVLDGFDFFSLIVRNIEVECFFKRHDELNDVERIRSQIINKRSAWVDLVLVHSQLLYDDLLYLVCYCCHYLSPNLSANTSAIRP